MEIDDWTESEVHRGMARAFFAVAYAEQAEECGQALRGEIMDQLPEATDPAATHAADTLFMDMTRANSDSILALYEKHSAGLEPWEWGHYAAMQALSQGVGLRDYAVRDEDVRVPTTEFGSHSLERDYFDEASHEA